MKVPQAGRNTTEMTLLELAVVVAIIGVLAAIVVPLVQDYQRRAKFAEVAPIVDTLVKGGIVLSAATDWDVAGDSIGLGWFPAGHEDGSDDDSLKDIASSSTDPTWQWQYSVAAPYLPLDPVRCYYQLNLYDPTLAHLITDPSRGVAAEVMALCVFNDDRLWMGGNTGTSDGGTDCYSYAMGSSYHWCGGSTPGAPTSSSSSSSSTSSSSSSTSSSSSSGGVGCSPGCMAVMHNTTLCNSACNPGTTIAF